MTYTISKNFNGTYSIHLGADLFYSWIDEAPTYEKAIELARTYAGENGTVLYKEDLFKSAIEI
jgi:hypothetical protein